MDAQSNDVGVLGTHVLNGEYLLLSGVFHVDDLSQNLVLVKVENARYCDATNQ